MVVTAPPDASALNSKFYLAPYFWKYNITRRSPYRGAVHKKVQGEQVRDRRIVDCWKTVKEHYEVLELTVQPRLGILL